MEKQQVLKIPAESNSWFFSCYFYYSGLGTSVSCQTKSQTFPCVQTTRTPNCWGGSYGPFTLYTPNTSKPGYDAPARTIWYLSGLSNSSHGVKGNNGSTCSRKKQIPPTISFRDSEKKVKSKNKTYSLYFLCFSLSPTLHIRQFCSLWKINK